MIDEKQVLLNVPASSQRDVIERLVQKAFELGKVTDVASVTEAVLKREQEGTTGFGKGIAIPHGKSAFVTEPSLFIAKTTSGLDWKAMDGQPVSTLFLILVPEGSHTEHLQILAKLARKLMHDDFVETVTQLNDEASLADFIRREIS
ncbi:PTS sugar transporter subunit IIA [Alicyclobacillus pomorum]|uniref:PTS sugar transporter subunit IIA n=1 Tax=Alicyclobacillus pomorum TaxID=204470 RepID=UPI00040BB7AB|nr:fructose PTS transporter subunit IIA [Alicyclobacillus pomorum]